MIEQLSIFTQINDVPHRVRAYPRVHRNDPMTSREAAERHRKGLGRQLIEVLSWIRRYPGSTACELAQRIATDPEHYVRLRYAISRRAPELRGDGHVRSGGARICTVSGSRQQTWYPL